MKRAVLFGAFLTVGLALALACDARRSDEQIREDFERLAKAEPDLAGAAVHAVSEDGRVTLRGYVQSEEARESAADIASEIAGVKGVRNEVQVVGTPSQPPPVGAQPTPTPPPSDERLSLPPFVEPEPGDLEPSPNVPPNPTPEM